MALTKKPTTTPNPKEEPAMSKPQSYFSIQEHEFTIKGRKGNADTKQTEPALFFQGELYSEEYIPLATVGTRIRFIKTAGLADIAEIADAGYDEKITGILLKEKGFKEISKILGDNKILALDFTNWVKEELAKIPSGKVGRPGSGKVSKAKADPEVTQLVGAMRLLAPEASPAALKAALVRLVADTAKLDQAEAILVASESKHKRDEKGYIKLRTRTK